MQLHRATRAESRKGRKGRASCGLCPSLQDICASLTCPQVTSLSGYPAGFTRLPPERRKGQFKPKSLEMLAMCELLESLSLYIAPVFTSECGWDPKVLSLDSLSGPRSASIHDRDVETTAVFHLLAGWPGQQLPPPQPSHTRAKSSSPSTRCKAPPNISLHSPRAGLPAWSTVTSSASRQPGEVTSQFPSL